MQRAAFPPPDAGVRIKGAILSRERMAPLDPQENARGDPLDPHIGSRGLEELHALRNQVPAK